jgi:putative ABC transport system substrate-binding protein
MKRRGFIAGLAGAAMAPFTVRAQQIDRVRRVGVLIAYAEDDPETKTRLAAFRLGLARRGWSEDRNVRIDYRFAAASAGQHQVLAQELIGLRPDVILAHTTALAAAVQRESRIPTVFVNVSNPIEAGLVASLARPGGHVTGVRHLEPGIVGKWLGMLKEIAPALTRVAFVANPRITSLDFFVSAGQSALPALGLEVVSSPVENSSADIERVLESLARVPTTGIVTPPDPTTIAHRDLIVALAARHRLPAVYPFTFVVAAGGLMSYGTDQVDMFRLAASYVDRILRGDKPADLPVHAPTRQSQDRQAAGPHCAVRPAGRRRRDHRMTKPGNTSP